mmetsp:Transcript_17599/g.34615  ORF Transcript_17599/g.34615 Transcript_17599/m.34615 type:complete len:499 (+) Transcript_17599:160-1656(+)
MMQPRWLLAGRLAGKVVAGRAAPSVSAIAREHAVSALASQASSTSLPAPQWTWTRLMSSSSSTSDVEGANAKATEDDDVEAKKAAKKKEKAAKKQSNSYVANASTVDEISGEDVARYFAVKDEDLARLLPEGVNEETEELFTVLGNKLFMVRESTTDTIDLMKRIEAGEVDPSKAVRLLMGERGMGKSISLQLAVMWARARGWIVMYVPDAREYVTEKGAIQYGTGTAAPLAQSKLRPKLLTQPLGAQAALKNIKAAHGEQLKGLKQKRKYPAKLYDADDSLMGIIERGLKTAPFAGDALLDLRLELGLVTEVPVMIAVDQINAFSWPTCFHENAVPVVPERLMMAETFRFLDSEGKLREQLKLARGLLLAAPTCRYGYPVDPKVAEEHRKQVSLPPTYYAPFNEIGDKLKVNEPEFVYEVQRYSEEELRNTVITYKRYKALDHPNPLEPVKIRALKAITAGIPREVHNFLWQPAYTLFAEYDSDIPRPNNKHKYSQK